MSKFNWKVDDDGIEEDEETQQYCVEYEPGVFGFISDENSSGSEWFAQFEGLGPNDYQEWGTEMKTKIKGYHNAVATVDAAYVKYKSKK